MPDRSSAATSADASGPPSGAAAPTKVLSYAGPRPRSRRVLPVLMASLPYQIVYVCFGLSLISSPFCMVIIFAVLPQAMAWSVALLLPPVALLLTSMSMFMISFASDRFVPPMLRVALLINCFDLFSIGFIH